MSQQSIHNHFRSCWSVVSPGLLHPAPLRNEGERGRDGQLQLPGHPALSPPIITSKAHKRKIKPQPNLGQSQGASHGIFCVLLLHALGAWAAIFYRNAKIYHFLNLLRRYFYCLRCFLLLFSLCTANETSQKQQQEREKPRTK